MVIFVYEVDRGSNMMSCM